MLEFQFLSRLLLLLRSSYISIGAILFLFLSSLLFSCSAEKRIARICRKNPNACKRDTTWNVFRDTMTISEVRIDTLFKASSVRDTLVINKDRVTMKYFYNKHDSTIYLSSKSDSSVKYISVPYPSFVNEVTIKRSFIDKISVWISFIGGAIFVFGFAFGWVQKIKNKLNK